MLTDRPLYVPPDAGTRLASRLDVHIEQVAFDESTPEAVEVVAAVEVHGVDVDQQPVGVDRVRRWVEEFDVVAVRAVECPADRDTVSVDADRPRAAELAPINRTGPGALWS